MLSLKSLLSSVERRIPPGELLHQFQPPLRFAPKRFESYQPRHASQARAADRLAELGRQLHATSRSQLRARLARHPRRRPSGGIYLDGGFGVGKTHLLASFWHSSPQPRAYLSFDELMFFIGMAGTSGAAKAFHGYRVLAVDEWELDDPGNLTMALAFLRQLLEQRVFVAVTSNTLPLDLGAGRFSQKDFRTEIDELASAFEILRIEGEDYRRRSFDESPGAEYYADRDSLHAALENAPSRTLVVGFRELLGALGRVHPIRFRDLAGKIDWLVVLDVERIGALDDALRWVHFIDSSYDARIRFSAAGGAPLRDLFPADTMAGPYGKKLSRCLSRMEEMLTEARV